MDGRFNTIAGWVLGAGIVFLGANLVVHEIFGSERPAKMGFPINGVEEEGEGGEAERPIAFYLQTADAARGQRAFSTCAGCHTVNQGGANGSGPNLWGVMGSNVAHRTDFNYTASLRNKGGRWDWDTMSQWLLSPADFAPGTRMTYGGMVSPQQRADILLYLNNNVGGTLTVPPPPAAEPAAGNEAAGNEAGANASAGNASAGNAAAPAANTAAPAPAPAPAGH